MAGILFEDIFDVKDIDPDGKKFDRGEEQWVQLTWASRFLSRSHLHDDYELKCIKCD